MKLMFFKLVYSLVSFIFLTQLFCFAHANNEQEKHSAISNGERVLLIPHIIQKSRRVIRTYNTKIQNLLVVISEVNSDEERDEAALRLLKLMEPTAYGPIKRSLSTLERIIINESYPVSMRISAIEAISEHTLPGYNLDRHITIDTNIKIRYALKETIEKLQENHIKTRKRFAKLHYFTSPYVREVWSLMWIDMYKYNADINDRLYQLLSNDRVSIQQIALLIADKLKEEYGIHINHKTRQKISQLRSKNAIDTLDSTQPSQPLSRPPQNNQETKENNPPAIGPCARRTFRSL